MAIVAVSGKAESGKDTFFNFVDEGYEFIVPKFAYGDYVKNVAFDIGWDGVKDKRGRALLQLIGDGARAYDEDIWVKKAREDIESQCDKRNIVILTDCRYPNEIDYFKELGYDVYSVRINRPGHESKLTFKQRLHISETALDSYKFDFVIDNSNSLEDYRRSAVSTFATILARYRLKWTA